MPLPRWLAKINKRVFNPMEIKRGKRPVLEHMGRKTGKAHQTPLDAHEVDDGYLFIVNYGSRCDWVRNIMASGTAHLRIGGDTFDLRSPRLVGHDEAVELLPAGTKRPPQWAKITEYLVMERS